MSFLPFPATTTSEAVALIKQDGGILHEIVHGGENAEVLTEGGLVPSVSKVLNDLLDRIGAGTGADVTLRSDLASAVSEVLIAGLKGKNLIGRVSGFVVDTEYTTLQEAINTLKPVKLTKVHNLDSVLVVKNIIFADSNEYGFLKTSNSGLLDLSTTGSSLYNISIYGNGATYTGGGVLISGGSDQHIRRCRIMDTQSNPITYSGATSGLRSIISDCDLYAQNRTTTYAVKYPDLEVNGDRVLTNIRCHGGLLADFNGCSTVLVTSCNSVGARFTGLSKKVAMSANRWAGGTLGFNLTLRGDGHTISGDIIATDLILDTDAQFCTVNAVATNIIDNSTNRKSNKIYGQRQLNTVQWLSSGVQPSVGSGELTSSLSREGGQVTATINLKTAPDTNYGTGSWIFRLPYNAAQATTGSVAVKNGSVYYTLSVCVIDKDTNDMLCFGEGASNPFNSGSPFTWSGDEHLTITINYEIG